MTTTTPPQPTTAAPAQAADQAPDTPKPPRPDPTVATGLDQLMARLRANQAPATAERPVVGGVLHLDDLFARARGEEPPSN